jgi:GTP cyclohydrolase-4
MAKRKRVTRERAPNKDVQNSQPFERFKLSRVGVRLVKKPVVVRRPDGRTVTLNSEIELFVDLPSDQKGSHLSRNVEVVGEILDRSVRSPVSGLEDLCAKISREMLKRHEYANNAEVRMTADYFLEREHSGKKSIEHYKLLARAIAERKFDTVRKMIGVEVTGMTACPCAMEVVRERLTLKHFAQRKLLQSIPVLTHNQRNVSSLQVEVPEEYTVEADDLIDIIEESVSSPTYEILKRGAEGSLVYSAHEKPRFVEDVVRNILSRVLKRYAGLPESVIVTVRSESEESIHKHNAVAERVTTLGELRAP